MDAKVLFPIGTESENAPQPDLAAASSLVSLIVTVLSQATGVPSVPIMNRPNCHSGKSPELEDRRFREGFSCSKMN